MKITRSDVEHIADLARIGLSAQELDKFTQEFVSILGYVEKLNELQIDQVKSDRGWLVDAAGQERVNIWREDEVTREEGERIRDGFLNLAPGHDDKYIKSISPFSSNQNIK